MLLLISPAKTLNTEPVKFKTFTQPRFTEQSDQLAGILKKKSAKAIKKLMHVSDKIATLNYQRYQDYQSEFTLDNSKQSIFTFKGDVYLGLEAETMTKVQLNFAQKHLRILSGLYGMLRPFDLMQAYRLEMGTPLRNKKGKNLYDFWGDQITDLINSDLADTKSKLVVNLASKEYFKTVKTKDLNAPVLDVDFREYRGEALKFISFSAKKARGLMCQYIIKNKIKSPEKIKGFNYEGYQFAEDLSTEKKWMFVR